MENIEALVIGAGPAGLMAASKLAAAGRKVLVVDAKSSLGRKFLMAGRSGLNLTKDEPVDDFVQAYGGAREWLEPMLRAFGPEQVKGWAEGLGQDVFTGSSGRLFPKSMKASPLLRSMLVGLADNGVASRTKWRWNGWDGQVLQFETPEGPRSIEAGVTILALGGASWSRLGSDGKWTEFFADGLAPFKPANMGFLCGWSKFMQPHYGSPVKPVSLSFGDKTVRGEFVVTSRGIEGGAVYSISAYLRDGMGPDGVTVMLDLVPDLELEQVSARLSKPRGKNSMSNHLRKTLGLKNVRAALLHEAGPLPENKQALAQRIKALPLALQGPTPIDEAISTAGGLKQSALTSDLMLKARPGVFCAGEMLDWEAPTGGYLLTACLATGHHAGIAAEKYLATNEV